MSRAVHFNYSSRDVRIALENLRSKTPDGQYKGAALLLALMGVPMPNVTDVNCRPRKHGDELLGYGATITYSASKLTQTSKFEFWKEKGRWKVQETCHTTS